MSLTLYIHLLVYVDSLILFVLEIILKLRLKFHRILHQQQWNMLYSPSVKSQDFDITLLFLLLRNICGLSAPATGWDNEPIPTDLSMEADLARIKRCRNMLYAHRVELALTDDEFESNWDKIEVALNRLGSSKYKTQIEHLKFASMDHQLDTCFYALLQSWEEVQEHPQVHITVSGIFKTVTAGGTVLAWAAGSAYFLNRYKEDPEMVIRLIQEAIIPSGLAAGAIVYALLPGSFKILIEIKSLAALEYIWKCYVDDTLRKNLEKVITDKYLCSQAPDNTEKVELSLTLSEHDYKKAEEILVKSSLKSGKSTFGYQKQPKKQEKLVRHMANEWRTELAFLLHQPIVCYQIANMPNIYSHKSQLLEDPRCHNLPISKLNSYLLEMRRPDFIEDLATFNVSSRKTFRKTLKKGKPTKEDLETLAKQIVKFWKILGLVLKIEEHVLIEIEVSHSDVYEQSLEMLNKWQKLNGAQATYDLLGEALVHPSVDRHDLRTTLCCLDTNKGGQILYPKQIPSFNIIFGEPFHKIYNRENEFQTLQTLHASLDSRSTSNDITMVYVIGPPGSGKTQLSILYSKWYSQVSFNKSCSVVVAMLRAETADSLLESYMELTRVLGISMDEDERDDDIKKRLKSYSKTIKNLFQNSKLYNFEWLVIVDNVFATNPLKEFWPLPGKGWGKGHVIVTTQDSELDMPEQIHACTLSLSKGMDEVDAIDLLCHVASLEEVESCAEVAKYLNYYPLSLACAAVFVQNMRCRRLTSNYSWKDCLVKLNKFLELLKTSEFTDHNICYPLSMLSAVICCANDLAEINIVFKVAFKFLSFCTIQPVPVDLVAEAVLDNLRDEVRTLDEVKQKLATCSLLSYSPKGVRGIDVITMHEVVRAAFIQLRKESNKTVADTEGSTVKVVDGRNFVEAFETLCQYYHRFQDKQECAISTRILLSPHLKDLTNTGKKMNLTHNEAFIDGLVCLADSLVHIALGTVHQRRQLLTAAMKIQMEIKTVKIHPDTSESSDDEFPAFKLEETHTVAEKHDVKMMEPTSDRGKLVRHMPYDGRQRLNVLLVPEAINGNNYKFLADKLGFTAEEIRNIETKDEPVKEIFNDRRCLDLTITSLKSKLLEMERHDVIEDLETFEALTLTPSEYERRYAERASAGLSEEFKNLTVLPDDLKYDAFICYPKREREFAKQILSKLEADPYHFKLCINYRDILPGGHELSTIVSVIEERCRKVIVLISKHFSEDIDADFQAKIALGLSPGCKEKRLIPIVMDNRKYVPAILKHITHLDYSNTAAREYFWPNLARALGYRD